MERPVYFWRRLFTFRQGLKAAGIVASTFNFLSVATLLFRPRKLWDFSKDAFGAFNNRVKPSRIPVRPIAEILPGGSRAASLFLSFDLPTGISMSELVCLCALSRLWKPKNVLEIGTFTGVTAYHLAKNSPDDCRVFTMDLPEDYRESEALRDVERKARSYTEVHYIHRRPRKTQLGYVGTDVEHKVQQIYADSTRYDYQRNFSEKFDLIFIDGSHDYATVKADTTNALQWVAEGGHIIWHDYKMLPEVTWGVRRFLDELSRKHPIVRIAGTSFCVLRKPR